MQLSIAESVAIPPSLQTTVRVEYSSPGEFQFLAKTLGILPDEKEGVFRTAFIGVVTFWRGNAVVHVAPKLPWNGYNRIDKV